MRLAVYGTVSTLAASGVVISAFAQRANFYSATVYLAQSNACLMILTNFSLLCSLLFAHILQRILYGPLRDLEVESLYEKAWYAVTETCLAMTIFRDEWNVGFVLCFAGLLFAKGFCWLSSGRVEMMEQTPPANPQLFHARLVASLFLLIGSDIAMVYYAVSDVLDAGKPGMMVMFAFEFTILLITALSTAGRYGLIMLEKVIVRKQANARRLARQAERAAAAARDPRETIPITQQEADEENDDEELEVVWEEKGTWMFYLELGTDFLKLLTYLAFFFIVLTFYGLPLHIIRDVYITLRSFISRIRDFVRYRRATNDMNTRYPDATEEEVERENVCIICREEMRPYIPTQENPGPQGVHAAAQAQQRQRMRPKKLPCGHILHFACLRSWLERQQRCPTCRRPVLEAVPAAADPNAPQGGAPQQPDGRRGGGGGIAWGGQFGGIRVNFGVGQGPEFMQNLVQQWENRPPGNGNAGVAEPVAPAERENPTERHQGDQQASAASSGTETVSLPQQLQPTGTTGLMNLRGLHIQCLELERRLRRELEAVEALNMTIGNARELRSLLSQAAQQPVTGTGTATVTNDSNSSNTGVHSTTSVESLSHTTTQTPLPPVAPGLQGIHAPPGWQVIPLTPVGVGASTAAESPFPNPSGTPVNITTTSPLHRPAVGTISATLGDLRRRRFGRGDVRNYNANLRDYHAVRSPSVELSENHGGLVANSDSSETTLEGNPISPSPNNTGASGLQGRLEEVFQDGLALDESTAHMNSAARELQLAPSHSRLLGMNEDSADNLSEEYVDQAERELSDAFENRRAVLALAHRILDESQQALGDRRSRTIASEAPESTSITSRGPQNEAVPDSNFNLPPAASPTQAMTPTESLSSSASAAEECATSNDKGKGRAATVEAGPEE